MWGKGAEGLGDQLGEQDCKRWWGSLGPPVPFPQHPLRITAGDVGPQG